MAAMYEKAALSVDSPELFQVVRDSIEAAFSATGVTKLLQSVERHKLRIRDFEDVLRAKLLGEPALLEYNRLNNLDQGQLRELYLARLEQVDPDLRQKYFKLYAYY